MNYYYRDELEINFKKLGLYILRRWKFIIIGVLLGGILGCGFIILSHKAQALSLNVEQEQQSPDDLKMKLTPKELRDVNLAYNAYLQCEELYIRIAQDQSNSSIEQDAELIKATQSILAINSSLTADQKLYYASLFEDEDSSTEIIQEIAPTSNIGNRAVKYTLLGAISVACVVILIIAFIYILTPTLKTEDDLRTAFKLPIIGRTKMGDEGSVGYIASSILACARKANVSNVYLVGSGSDEATKSLKDKVSDLLMGKGVDVVASSNIITDPMVIDALIDSDGVILFEKIGESKYEDIAREIELCRNFGIDVLGAVVIQ